MGKVLEDWGREVLALEFGKLTEDLGGVRSGGEGRCPGHDLLRPSTALFPEPGFRNMGQGDLGEEKRQGQVNSEQTLREPKAMTGQNAMHNYYFTDARLRSD